MAEDTPKQTKWCSPMTVIQSLSLVDQADNHHCQKEARSGVWCAWTTTKAAAAAGHLDHVNGMERQHHLVLLIIHAHIIHMERPNMACVKGVCCTVCCFPEVFAALVLRPRFTCHQDNSKATWSMKTDCNLECCNPDQLTTTRLSCAQDIGMLPNIASAGGLLCKTTAVAQVSHKIARPEGYCATIRATHRRRRKTTQDDVALTQYNATTCMCCVLLGDHISEANIPTYPTAYSANTCLTSFGMCQGIGKQGHVLLSYQHVRLTAKVRYIDNLGCRDDGGQQRGVVPCRFNVCCTS